MPPRGYRVSKNADVTAYTVRDIPLALWKRARVRAVKEGTDMRTVLLRLLERYAAKGIDE
jgi:hypothetical protein